MLYGMYKYKSKNTTMMGIKITNGRSIETFIEDCRHEFGAFYADHLDTYDSFSEFFSLPESSHISTVDKEYIESCVDNDKVCDIVITIHKADDGEYFTKTKSDHGGISMTGWGSVTPIDYGPPRFTTTPTIKPDSK